MTYTPMYSRQRADFEAQVQPLVDAAETARDEAVAASLSPAISALNQAVDYDQTTLPAALEYVNGSQIVDFTTGYYRNGLSQSGDLSALGILSCTRSTAAVLKKADNSGYDGFAINTPRYNSAGLLIEAAATNLITSSTDYSAWNNGNSVTIAAGQTAPDGTATATTITDDSTLYYESKDRSGISITAGQGVKCFSAAVKKAVSSQAALAWLVSFSGGGAGTTTYTLRLDPYTGEANSSSAGAPVTVEDCGTYWRMWAPVTPNALHNTLAVTIYPAQRANLSASDNVSNTASATVWRAVLEQGSTPSTPIEATRGADTMTIALPAGDDADVITVEYTGGNYVTTRADLADPLELVLDSTGPWAGKLIQRWRLTNAASAIGETVVRVRNAIATGGIAGNSALSPTVTVATSSTLSGTTYKWNNAALTFLGATLTQSGASFPDTESGRPRGVEYATPFGTSWNGTGALEFMHTGASFEYRQKAFAGINVRILVDGEVITGGPWNLNSVTPGNSAILRVVFGSSATRRIRIEQTGAGPYLYDVKVGTGESIAAISDRGLRMLIAADSFGEPTGPTYEWQGPIQLLAEEMGVRELWNTSSGGTGWLQTRASPARINFLDRFDNDVLAVNADIYLIWNGYNDIADGNDATIQTQASAKIAALKAAHPKAKIYVIGPPDTSAPSAAPASYTSMNAAMQAVATANGVTFINLAGVSFSKADGIHPDNTGAVTLKDTILAAIVADIG